MKASSQYLVVSSLGFAIFLLTLATIYQLPATSYAATPSATPSADIKSKLQSLQQEIASKAAQIKAEVGKKLQNRAFVGFVKSKSETSLTLATKTGSRIVNINQDTEYISEVKSSGASGTKAKFSAKTISNDDYLVALGDMDESSVISAKQIIKLNPPPTQTDQLIWGVVTEVGSSIFIKGKDERLYTILTDSKTDYLFGDLQGDKTDIKVQKPLIALGSKLKDRELKASFIYILPYTTAVKPKTATPSATPKSNL